MFLRLAPMILAAAIVWPIASAARAETSSAPVDSTAAEAPARHETRMAWAVCRVSWKIAWEVPGAGSLALGACLYAIHADLEDYFSPGRQ